MPVPGAQLVIGAVLERAVPPAIEAVKKLYANMGWSKDRGRVQKVQMAVTETIEDAAALARVIPADHLQPHIEQALSRFRSRLVQEQIPAEDADHLTQALRAQVQTTVVEPLQHRTLVSDRLASLEAESDRLLVLEPRLGELEERALRMQNAMWFALGAVGALSLIAAILSIVAIAGR